ncbi:MAG: DUF1573 domain-containing protein [Bacteroidales bacterium]|nr:DUF1573 domain-containing protein [Bacteroidales bacterium]
MKTIRFIFIATFLFAVWNAQAQNRLRIAILDLDAGVNRTQQQVNGLADMLSVELFNSGCFTIVERSKVEKVIREQHFRMTYLTDAQRKKIGGTLKVDAIVTGTINFIPRDTHYGSDYSSKHDVGEYNVDIRLVSVNTGEWLSVAGGEQKGCTERELMRRVAMELTNNLELSNPNVVAASSPYLLYDYLYVYPEDLGVFTSAPTFLIQATNKNSSYGYNDWRLPTQEELDALNSNRKTLRMNGRNTYAHANSWRYGATEFSVRLVRTAVLMQQSSIPQGSAYFESTTCNWGRISVLSGSARGQFVLQNPTSSNVYIQNVTNTSSALTVNATSRAICPGESGIVEIWYNPNGRQGMSINNSIKVTLSDGQQITLNVKGFVE